MRFVRAFGLHKRVLFLGCVLACVLCLFQGAFGAEGRFAVRGIKGLWWDGVENYRLALPWLAEHQLNFLMFCYTSFPASAKDWRSAYSPDELESFRTLAAQAKELRVNLCLSFNPAIWSNPPLEYSSDQDYRIILDKVLSVHERGISWFALCLDDINRDLTPSDKERFGSLQAAQVYLVNRLWADMQRMKPRPKLIFCPSAYSTRDMTLHPDYIKAIGAGISKDVQIFWTGPEVCSASIARIDAEKVAQWLRRKPFVWDNYPVNDMYPWRPLLAPVQHRAPDLAGAVSGFMANPMKQFHASTLPLTTLAWYLNDPASYNSETASQRLIHAFPPETRGTVRLLLELYGNSFWGDGAFPPRPRPSSRTEANRMLGRYRALQAQMQTHPELAALLSDIRPTLEEDIHELDHLASRRAHGDGLLLFGDRFSGGGAELYGRRREGRWVNYVYAQPTGQDEMRAEFSLSAVPKAAELRVLALNDDFGNRPKISVSINAAVVFEGESPFTSEAFSERQWRIPPGALKPGSNTIAIANLETVGSSGMPPWFMVAEAQIEDAGQPDSPAK